MESTILKDAGLRIRYYRKLKGFMQEQLSEVAGFIYSYIGTLERGQYDIRLQTLDKVTAALGVGIPDLLSDDTESENMSDDILATVNATSISLFKTSRIKLEYVVFRKRD